MDEKTGYTTKNMLVCAMKGPDGKSVGVVQAINKNPDKGPFTEEVCNDCSQAVFLVFVDFGEPFTFKLFVFEILERIGSKP